MMALGRKKRGGWEDQKRRLEIASGGDTAPQKLSDNDDKSCANNDGFMYSERRGCGPGK
jgi:hypothetical protein